MEYGFSGLVKRVNSNQNTFTQPVLTVTPVRVLSILLDETHPKFEELGGWNSIGLIEFEPVNLPTGKSTELPVAFPINSNIKHFPLENEIVYLLSLPDTSLDQTVASKRSYYINIVGLWNHPHHNAYPSNPSDLPDSQKKDYIQTQQGNVRKVTDESTEIKLGDTFKEKTNIHPLLPFEGDIIYEGRWGSSIRFGSTVKNKSNNWSNTGENGDPIVIIRNGQPTNSTQEGWIPITEDINKDISSIYETSTQQIPLEISSETNYNSYKEKPIGVKEYKESQIILNSGRLVFNSNKDHILFSSPKSVGFSSKESVNIDSPNTIIKSDKIYLGDKEAKEPIILGNKFLEDFNSLLTDITQLSTVLQSLVSLPQGTPYIVLAAPSTKLNLTIAKLQNSLQDYKSKISFSK